MLGLIGLGILLDGSWLVTLGGSPYYLIGRFAVMLSGVLIWRSDARRI